MLFSITIPAYKKRFLADAIGDCLAQTYQDFELIIVNDDSPEDLESIIKGYSDKRLRYYRNETNCGAVNVVDNWNKCLEYAKGDYIICMGDDDRLLPNCLEEYVKLIKKYPGLGVYHAWTEIIDEESNFKEITAARCEYESVYSFIWHRWDNRKQQFIGDFLFDTKLLRENGGFYKLPLAWGSDDISATIAAIPHGIANTQIPCFCYRINSQTISNTGNISIKLQSINKEKNWYLTFLQHEPQTELDKKFRMCIIEKLPHIFDKKKASALAKDIRCHSLFRAFYWLLQRKKFDIKINIIVYSVIMSLKR